MPVILSRTTINAARTFAVGGQLGTSATLLAEEGLRMFGASKLRAGVALVILAGGLAVGSGALFGVSRDQPGGKDARRSLAPPGSPDPSLPAGLVFRHGGRHSGTGPK